MVEWENKYQESFHKNFLQVNRYGQYYGGVFLMSSFQVGDRELFKTIRDLLQNITDNELGEEIYQNHNIKLYLDYYNDPDVNAFASRYSNDNSLYFIAINAGTALKTFGLFQSLFACTPIFPEYQGVEKYEQLDITALLSAPLTNLDYVRFNRPNSERNVLANVCHLIALEYLYFHELTHILHGHIDVIEKSNSKNTNLSLGETNDIGQIEISMKERHCMEINADQQAIWWCLDFFTAEKPVLVLNFFKLDWKGYFTLLMFCATILTHTFDRLKSTFKLHEYSSTHPHPEFRLNCMYSTFMDYIDKMLLNGEYLKEVVVHGMFQAGRAYEFHFQSSAFPNSFSPNNKDKVFLTSMQEFSKYYFEYQKSWSKYKKNGHLEFEDENTEGE